MSGATDAPSTSEGELSVFVTSLVETYRHCLLEWAADTPELLLAPLDHRPLPALAVELMGAEVRVSFEVAGHLEVATGHFSAPDLLCGAILARLLAPDLPSIPRAWAPRLLQYKPCSYRDLARATHALRRAGEHVEARACAERIHAAGAWVGAHEARPLLEAELAQALPPPEFELRLPKRTTYSGAAKRIVVGLADKNAHVRASAARHLESLLSGVAYDLLKIVPTVLAPLIAAAADDAPFVREPALAALHVFAMKLGHRRAYAEARACLDPVADAGVDLNAVHLLRWEALLALGEPELAAQDRKWFRPELYRGVPVGWAKCDVDEAIGVGLTRAARHRLAVALGQDTCTEPRKAPPIVPDQRAKAAALDEAANLVAEALPIMLPRIDKTLEGLAELVRAAIAKYPPASQALLAKGVPWSPPRTHLRYRLDVLDVQAAVLEAQGDARGALDVFRRAQEAHMTFNPFADPPPHQAAIARLLSKTG